MRLVNDFVSRRCYNGVGAIDFVVISEGIMPEHHNKLTKDEVRDIDRHVGSRMRYRRIMMNLSQTFLAERVGLSFQQFQKYEMIFL